MPCRLAATQGSRALAAGVRGQSAAAAGRIKREIRNNHPDILYQFGNADRLALRDNTPRVYVIAQPAVVAADFWRISALPCAACWLSSPSQAELTALLLCGPPSDPAL